MAAAVEGLQRRDVSCESGSDLRDSEGGELSGGGARHGGLTLGLAAGELTTFERATVARMMGVAVNPVTAATSLSEVMTSAGGAGNRAGTEAEEGNAGREDQLRPLDTGGDGGGEGDGGGGGGGGGPPISPAAGREIAGRAVGSWWGGVGRRGGGREGTCCPIGFGASTEFVGRFWGFFTVSRREGRIIDSFQKSSFVDDTFGGHCATRKLRSTSNKCVDRVDSTLSLSSGRKRCGWE